MSCVPCPDRQSLFPFAINMAGFLISKAAVLSGFRNAMVSDLQTADISQESIFHLVRHPSNRRTPLQVFNPCVKMEHHLTFDQLSFPLFQAADIHASFGFRFPLVCLFVATVHNSCIVFAFYHAHFSSQPSIAGLYFETLEAPFFKTVFCS